MRSSALLGQAEAVDLAGSRPLLRPDSALQDDPRDAVVRHGSNGDICEVRVVREGVRPLRGRVTQQSESTPRVAATT